MAVLVAEIIDADLSVHENRNMSNILVSEFGLVLSMLIIGIFSYWIGRCSGYLDGYAAAHNKDEKAHGNPTRNQ